MKSAIYKDINHDYLEAVKSYENEINSETGGALDDYTNLSFLYWSFAFQQFEFNIPNNIPGEWSIIGAERYQVVLQLGFERYHDSIELHFWKRYYQHIIYGEDFSSDDCKRLLETHNQGDSKVPYFFLYLFDEDRYINEINALLVECENIPTAKNLYIKSMIE